MSLIASGLYLFAPALPDDLSLPNSQLRLAAWLGVTWSMDPHDPQQILALAHELKSHGVRDLYVYVSYLKADDTFNRTFDHAEDFVRQMKALVPEMRLLAWIGVPVSQQLANGVTIDNRLALAEIRQTIADFSRFVVSELGFAGVHLNAELVSSGDPMFLLTLQEIRQSLPHHAILSTTANPLRLDSARTALPYPVVAHHWSQEYFRNVAQASDQIVLMAYDSGLVFPRDYLGWISYQAETSQKALNGLPGELIIGLPSSEEWTASHQTQAETLQIAFAGLRSGMGERIDGIAIYPFWETDDAEWRLIDSSLGR